MVQFAINVQPDMVTLVPENHQEITTESGMNVAAKIDEISKIVMTLKNNDIATCIFIDPETEQVKASKKVGADFVEFSTARYASACDLGSIQEVNREISAIQDMTVLAKKYGLRILAGHGLNYRNVEAIAAIEGIEELNIGHSIVARAALVGLERAVKEMLELIRRASA